MARALAVREPPITTTSRAGQHHAPIRAGILIAIERIETISEFLSLFAIAGFFYLLPLRTIILPLGQASELAEGHTVSPALLDRPCPTRTL